jgi:hypothetical protein
LDRGLIEGNEEAIKAWKTARDLRADFGRRFDDSAVISKIIDEELTQEETLNLIFGGSQMGFKNKAGSTIKEIKKVLSPESAEFKALKEEAILRLVKNQSDSKRFSGAKFDTALNKALKDNPTLMRELFNKDEIADLRNFARVAKDITERQPGAVNPSSSFNKMARALQGSGVLSGFANNMAEFVVKPFRDISGARRVEDILDISEQVKDLRTDPDLVRRALAISVGAQNDGG